MNNPTIYSDGVANSIQDSPLRVQNKILGALKNMGGDSCTINTDSVFSASSTAQVVLAANTSRRFLSIQNIGNSKVYIRFGAAPVITGTKLFSYILAPSSGTENGDGGVLTVDGYTGSVYVATSGSDSSTVIATDFNN
tara:strand:+ start:410 stop:823 length:414 start_codon:yes stop_codon:yes gene_type:complete